MTGVCGGLRGAAVRCGRGRWLGRSDSPSCGGWRLRVRSCGTHAASVPRGGCFVLSALSAFLPLSFWAGCELLPLLSDKYTAHLSALASIDYFWAKSAMCHLLISCNFFTVDMEIEF